MTKGSKITVLATGETVTIAEVTPNQQLVKIYDAIWRDGMSGMGRWVHVSKVRAA